MAGFGVRLRLRLSPKAAQPNGWPRLGQGGRTIGDQTTEVDFDVDLQRRIIFVPLEQNLAGRLAARGHRPGLSTETPVNPWLRERLQQVTGVVLRWKVSNYPAAPAGSPDPAAR